MKLKFLVGLAVTGISIAALASTVSAAPPNCVVVDPHGGGIVIGGCGDDGSGTPPNIVIVLRDGTLVLPPTP